MERRRSGASSKRPVCVGASAPMRPPLARRADDVVMCLWRIVDMLDKNDCYLNSIEEVCG